MHLPIVMMLALSGLGCHNKANTGDDAAAMTRIDVDAAALPSYQGAAHSAGDYSHTLVGTPYPEIPYHSYAPYQETHSSDWHAQVRSTLYSFVCGHDPDVSTAREIEASVYGIEVAH
jgi:hypothetical protein